MEPRLWSQGGGNFIAVLGCRSVADAVTLWLRTIVIENKYTESESVRAEHGWSVVTVDRTLFLLDCCFSCLRGNRLCHGSNGRVVEQEGAMLGCYVCVYMTSLDDFTSSPFHHFLNRLFLFEKQPNSKVFHPNVKTCFLVM